MYSNCITSLKAFFPPTEDLQSTSRKKSNSGFRKQPTRCPPQHWCPRGPPFPLQSLNLSPFYSYAFGSSHFNGWFHHILKYTSLEDTTVCSASNIFITFYYRFGSREVSYLIWRTCPVSFIFLQDFYWVNLIQLWVFYKSRALCYSSYLKKNLPKACWPYSSLPTLYSCRISFPWVTCLVHLLSKYLLSTSNVSAILRWLRKHP